jgi:phage terminase small subunit
MAATGRKPDKLTGQELAYCYEHVANNGNGTEACRQAGYKGSDNTLGVASTRLLKKDKIQKKIAELRERFLKSTEMRAERVMHNLALLANQKASDFFREDPKTGTLEPKKLEEMQGKDACIKELTIIPIMVDGKKVDQKVRLKLRDNIKPNEILAKHYKLISDNVDHRFPDGEFANTKEIDVSGMSTKELKEFRKLLEKAEGKPNNEESE